MSPRDRFCCKEEKLEAVKFESHLYLVKRRSFIQDAIIPKIARFSTVHGYGILLSNSLFICNLSNRLWNIITSYWDQSYQVSRPFTRWKEVYRDIGLGLSDFVGFFFRVYLWLISGDLVDIFYGPIWICKLFLGRPIITGSYGIWFYVTII